MPRPKNGRRKPPRRPSGRNSNVKVRPYFTTRNGRKVYAKDYGHHGWPIGR